MSVHFSNSELNDERKPSSISGNPVAGSQSLTINFRTAPNDPIVLGRSSSGNFKIMYAVPVSLYGNFGQGISWIIS